MMISLLGNRIILGPALLVLLEMAQKYTMSFLVSWKGIGRTLEARLVNLIILSVSYLPDL